MEFIEHPVVKACREMIEVLSERAKDAEPWHAAACGNAAAVIIKELRKAGAFGAPKIVRVGDIMRENES